MHKTEAELLVQLQAASELVAEGATYIHYKQGHHYKVLRLAITEADSAVCVVYEAQYGKKVVFVRSLESWLSKVDVDGKTLQRFTKMV